MIALTEARNSGWLRMACVLSMSLMVGTAQAAVRAWLDSNSIASDGTVQMTLERDGQTNAEPDLSPLEQDFDILSKSSGTSMQIINGSVSSHVRLDLSLSPKHAGQIRIPAISWAGEHSDPLSLNVAGSTNGTSPSGPPPSRGSRGNVYLETTVDPRQPYVQAGAKLTVRLYAAVPLYHADLDLPSSNDVLVIKVGDDHSETQVVNGERYQVIERHYELFPQHSGSINVPGPVLNAQIAIQARNTGDPFQDFFGNSFGSRMFMTTKPIHVHGDPIELNVLPRPATAPSDYWLPARSVNLESDWHPDEAKAKTGEPFTLHLKLDAEGLTAGQLPDLNALLKLPPGLKAYPDQPKLTNETKGDTLIGTRDQNIAIIADQAGRFTVPGLVIRWWDTGTNRLMETTLPERTFTITPAATAAATQNSAAPSAQPAAPQANRSDSRAAGAQSGSKSDPWRWASFIAVALWFATLVAWYVTHRRKPQVRRRGLDAQEDKEASVSRARRDFQSACRADDPRAARASLSAWIKAARPELGMVGPRAFAKQVGDPRLSALLLELDSACYGGSKWTGAALLDALRELPSRDGSREHDEALAPLYR